MSSVSFAVALATAIVVLCPALPRAENAVRSATAFQWRHVNDMHELVSGLEDWLDAQTDWHRREAPPRARLVSKWEAAARKDATASYQRGRPRGLYDPERSEILLVRPWNPRNAEDVSILLHELVHHRQAPHHWYCPAAQELPAYRLQEAWLTEQGLAIEINWMAAVLDAGCTPHDIHPE
jgi:hypothetical protein